MVLSRDGFSLFGRSFKTTSTRARRAARERPVRRGCPATISAPHSRRFITSQYTAFPCRSHWEYRPASTQHAMCESLFATGTYPEPTCPWFTPHSFTHFMELLALMYIYPSGPDDKNRSVHVAMRSMMPGQLCQYCSLHNTALNSRQQQGTGL
jgi:hypothetical protein